MGCVVCLTLRPPLARRLGAGPGLQLGAGPEANRLQRCHYPVVRPSRRREALAIGLAAVTLLCVLAIVALDSLVRDVGRADLAQLDALGTIPYMVTIATSTATGALVALRRPAHPVGWLFLALGVSIALGGLLDSYGRYGAVARPGSVPAADLAAVLGDGIFVLWFVLVALILHQTPTGSALTLSLIHI